MVVLTQQAESTFNTLSENDKQAVVQAAVEANPSWIPDDVASKRKIWMALIVGMLVLAAIAIVAAVVLTLSGKEFNSVLLIASAVVAGLLGLFAKSPAA